MKARKSSRAKEKFVLIVEDDPSLRKLMQAQLRAMDFEPVICGDGRSAMAELKKRRFDLVCLDLMLPEVSGFDLCEHIRNELGDKTLPILIISGRALPEDRAFAEEVGASAYLIKPFSRPDLIDQVHYLLGLTSPFGKPLRG